MQITSRKFYLMVWQIWIIDYKLNHSPTEGMKSYWYCHCTPSTFKFMKYTKGFATAIAQTPKSALLNKLYCLTMHHLPRWHCYPICSANQSLPQPEVCGDQNGLQQHDATLVEVRTFMQKIMFIKTSWTLLSNVKHLMVKESWESVFCATNHWQTIAQVSADQLSVCQLPSSPSLNLAVQIPDAVS